MLLPSGGYQPGHKGTGGVGWGPPSEGTAVIPPQAPTDYKALAQELATVLLRYEKKLRYTSDEMDMDAVDVLLKARAAGLEVP
jgi:hypothetical protein